MKSHETVFCKTCEEVFFGRGQTECPNCGGFHTYCVAVELRSKEIIIEHQRVACKGLWNLLKKLKKEQKVEVLSESR